MRAYILHALHTRLEQGYESVSYLQEIVQQNYTSRVSGRSCTR